MIADYLVGSFTSVCCFTSLYCCLTKARWHLVVSSLLLYANKNPHIVLFPAPPTLHPVINISSLQCFPPSVPNYLISPCAERLKTSFFFLLCKNTDGRGTRELRTQPPPTCILYITLLPTPLPALKSLLSPGSFFSGKTCKWRL